MKQAQARSTKPSTVILVDIVTKEYIFSSVQFSLQPATSLE